MTVFITPSRIDAEQKPLSAAEISALWLQYMGDTLSKCVYQYFMQINESQEIRPILEYSLRLAESHVADITRILNNENFQIPAGFNESDVNLNAPRLFSDSFMLYYSYLMTIHGLTAYSLALSASERQDIQDHFFRCLASANDLFRKITNVTKSHPKFSSVPTIPSPAGVKFMESTGILSNLIGEKRPLNSSEISNLFFNSKKTGFVRALSLAFSQVAEKEDVTKFMAKNAALAGEDADSFDAILRKDDLSIPQRFDDEITNSTIRPFSDKLMMYHAALLVNTALSYYGAAIGSSLRSDIILNYKRVFNHATEAGALCFGIMVKHGWMEEQPEAIDRKALSRE